MKQTEGGRTQNSPARVARVVGAIRKLRNVTTNIGAMPSSRVADAQWTAAEVREWAMQQGIGVAQRGRVPAHLVQLYLARPSVVREWARQRGIEIGRRGPLPADLLELYLARPSAVREWARQQGIEIGDRGRIPADLIESYLEQFGELTRRAA
ncbi:MAG TPA: histone-like nucleoid-structuring protein Lsr2 [Acidimicrobiales bacterium]|nr:histone-like nucleoid-structuring protein Lsr2 [Acidimicrobiales bacterium]